MPTHWTTDESNSDHTSSHQTSTYNLATQQTPRPIEGRAEMCASRSELDRQSDLIGQIYDCTINPERWTTALQAICAELGGHSAGIVLLDYQGKRDRLVRDWGPTTDWGQRMAGVLDSVKSIHRQFLGISGPQAEQPILLPPALRPDVGVFETAFYQQWAKPQGIHQVLEAVALSEPTRLGLFCVTRHEDNGHFSTGQIDLLHRLAPHIRRAITISDLLDLKTVERQAFAAVIEHLLTAVLVVGADRHILHANSAAKTMLAGGRLIREDQFGNLRALDTDCNEELMAAITSAERDEAKLGGIGISVPLRGNRGGDRPAVAHVLPLSRGDIRTRLVPQALAAVFINTAGEQPFEDLGAVASAFGMTPHETLLVEQLLGGKTLVAAAGELGIMEATAKTQLSSVFGRVGVKRQIDLLALIRRLVPPVRH